MRVRGQTLFYTDAVNYLREIFPPDTYTYSDDTAADLIISHESIIYVCEIKSEKECQDVSTTQGKAFKDLREKINSLSFLKRRGDGKYKGWLAFLAQPWWYLNNMESDNYTVKKNILIIPYDKFNDLKEAINIVNSNVKRFLKFETMIKRSQNVAVLIFKYEELCDFFQKIKNYNGGQS